MLSIEVSIIEEILFDKNVEIVLLSAKSYKVEGTIGIGRKFQVTNFFFLDTGADQSLFWKRSHRHRCEIAFSVVTLRFRHQ